MKNSLRRVFALTLIFSFLVFPFADQPAMAAVKADWMGVFVGFPTADMIMQFFMTKLGVDDTSGEIQKTVATYQNNSVKKMVPQVSIDFSTPAPAAGEELIATAVTAYFMNDPSSLYYTWFLKRNACKGDYKSECDLDKNGKVNIEDYKIDAARQIANGGFDWESEKYTASDGVGDSYRAVLGGDDQRGKDFTLCFVHDAESGKDYQLTECKHLFPDAPGQKTGDGNFGLDEEKFWHTDPKSADTAMAGNPDEANVAGLGQALFRWNYQLGDEIGVAVEGISNDPTTSADSSYKVFWALSRNNCPIEKPATDSDYSKFLEFPSGGVVTTAHLYVDPETGETLPSSTPTTTLTTTTVVTQDTSSTASNGDTIATHTVLTKTETSNTVTGKTTTTINIVKTETTTDNHSIDPDTGLPFSPPRTIVVTTTTNKGVAVDETGNTATGTTTTQITTVNNTVSPATTTVGPTTTTTQNFTLFSMNSGDINDCLEDNFISPAGGNPNQKINLSLNYLPESPLNDPTGLNSSTLAVSATTFGSNNPDLMNYEWRVFKSNVPNPESWGSSQVLKADLVGSGPTSGVGVKELTFKLQFNPAPKFLKVDLIASEPTGPNSTDTQGGRASLVIPIASSSNRIDVYSPSLSSASKLTLGTQRCAEGKELSNCPVVRNEIIGIRINPTNLKNFMWTIDNKPFSFSECFFDGLPGSTDSCDVTKQTNFAYFPVLKNNGETHTVKLVATNDKTGEQLNLTRTFQVVPPALHIVPADSTVAPVLLGNYIGLEGELIPDYSTAKFEAVSGSTIKVKPLFNTSFIDPVLVSWSVDGQDVSLDADGTLSFSATKALGDSYSISASGLYVQPMAFRQFLNKQWGVGMNQFFETIVDHSITVDLVNSIYNQNSLSADSAAPKKIMATIFASLPAYFIFVFRLLLTTFLMLFTTWVLFSLFPSYNGNTEISENKNEKKF